MLKGQIVDLNKMASVDVDAECCFSELCKDELPVPGALEIVDELHAQARLAKKRVGSKDAHSEKSLWIATKDQPQLTPIKGHLNLDLRWNCHGVPGTKGFEFLPGLSITDYDFMAYKGIELDMHPYGACFHDLADTMSTGMIEFLHFHKINTTVVGGLAISYCLKVTVLQLCRAGFRVFVNLAACRDLAGADTAASIKEMEAAGAIMLKNAAEIDNAPRA